MHSIKQVDGAPPNGRRVGPRLESRGRRNRFQSHPLEVPPRARPVRGRRHQHEARLRAQEFAQRIRLLRGIGGRVQHREALGRHPECLRGLSVTLRHGRRATRRLDPEDPIPVTIPNPRRFAPIAGWPASPERVAGFTWNPRPATRGMGGQLHEANPNALAALHHCPECLLKAMPSGAGKEAPVAY